MTEVGCPGPAPSLGPLRPDPSVTRKGTQGKVRLTKQNGGVVHKYDAGTRETGRSRKHPDTVLLVSEDG